jgi:hypothetical protein
MFGYTVVFSWRSFNLLLHVKTYQQQQEEQQQELPLQVELAPGVSLTVCAPRSQVDPIRPVNTMRFFFAWAEDEFAGEMFSRMLPPVCNSRKNFTRGFLRSQADSSSADFSSSFPHHLMEWKGAPWPYDGIRPKKCSTPHKVAFRKRADFIAAIFREVQCQLEALWIAVTSIFTFRKMM